MILTSASVFIIIIIIFISVSLLISVLIMISIMISITAEILILIIILIRWEIRLILWKLLTSILSVWVKSEVEIELNNESLIRICSNNSWSDMFNDFEDLNNKVLIKNSNIFRSVKFSDFIRKNRLHFAEKLFNLKYKIC